MTNLYRDGETDKRQSVEGAGQYQASLFRKRYRQLNPSEIALHDEIKDQADVLARLFTKVLSTQTTATTSGNLLDNLAENRGANVTLALRHLEDAVYRAVKALTT